MSKNGKKPPEPPPAFMSPEYIRRFNEELERSRPRTKEEARAQLVKLGIYTKSGRLTKKYR